MITIEGLKKANEHISKIDVKGKAYATVPARIIEFRTMCPEGSITTDIVAIDEDSVVMKTTITDENGKVLATGMAREEKASSFINKTSHIENCETSAVGRALGMLGIGSNESIASAEEVMNAINNQKAPAEKPKKEKLSDEEMQIRIAHRKTELAVSDGTAIKCYMCGNPITDHKKEDGTVMTVQDIVNFCKQDKRFVKPHCPECMKKKAKNLKARKEREQNA